MKRITLGDIAERLNISKMTVSLALRDDPSIGEKTRQQVRTMSQELGYIKNGIAKGLVSGKTNTIAALVGGALHDDYQNQLLLNAVDYALSHGYALMIALTDSNAAIERKTIDRFREMMVDGFLAFHCSDESNYRYLQELEIPFVLYTKYFQNFECDYVVCNDKRGGREITNYLLGLGHKKIVFLYDWGIRGNTEVLNRLHGYKESLEENGIPYDPNLVVPYNFTREEDSTSDYNSELIKCLRSADPPTAIFACNDTVAAYLYRMLKSIGCKIPEDVSVVGYEGVYLGSMIDPQLTTITSPIREMGRRSCELLIQKIEKKIPLNEYKKISLDPILTIRNSTIRK